MGKVDRFASGKSFGELNDSLADDLLVVSECGWVESPHPRPTPPGVFGVIVYGGQRTHRTVE